MDLPSVSAAEGVKEGESLSPAVLDRILGCEDDWLIPHGESPFSITRNEVLPASEVPYLFPDSLREGFLSTHVLANQGEVYDLWECKADAVRR